MVKNCISIIILILNLFTINAQSTTELSVRYKQVLNLNSSAPIDDNGIDAVLTTDGKKSFYVYNKVYDDTLKEGKIITIKTGKTGGFTRFYNQDVVGEGINKAFISDTLISRHFVMKKAFIIKDVLPKFDWVIQQENKKIKNVSCQRATVNYKGRKYQAWFAPSIPFSDGPWKFHGLPGLILEIYDDTNEIKFIFDSINTSTTILNNFPAFKGDIVKDMKELQKIKEQEDIKLIQRIESSLPKGGTGGTDVKYSKAIELDEQ